MNISRFATLSLAALLGTLHLAQAAEPVVDDINWPGINAYCTFSRAGQTFVFDNPETWKFVAFTSLADKSEGDQFRSLYASVGGHLREFALKDRSANDAGEVISFVAASDSTLTVSLLLGKPRQGEEASGYSGTLEVAKGADKAVVAITGNCGV